MSMAVDANDAQMVWTRVDTRALETADCRVVDRVWRSIARFECAVEADELAVLCIIDRRKIWKQLGRATIVEYIEEVFGHGPKVGYERLRVAHALENLPEMREAFAIGEVSYSALRELTRVATKTTQREWLDNMRGRNLREIEEAVRTHRKGELPTDPPTPNLAPVRFQVELSRATHALIRHARNVLAETLKQSIDDEMLYAAMATNLITACSSDVFHAASANAPRAASSVTDEASPKAVEADATAVRIVVVGTAKHQIRTTVCERCEQTFFEGGGRMIAVTKADAEMAQCDAQRIGLDQRATQDVSPSTRRFVAHRDHGKCGVPTCRSSRNLELHHVVSRSRGGTHDASNLTLLCDGHHNSLHDKKLTISGVAPNLSFQFTNKPTQSLHVETPPDSSKYALAVMKTDAKQALSQLGFKRAASKLVERALQIEPNPSSLEALIRTALKCSTSREPEPHS